MTKFLEAMYEGKLLQPATTQDMLNLLAEKSAGDSVRLWTIAPDLPEGSMIYNKRGSLTNPKIIVADAGVIVLPDGKAWILCLFGYSDEWTIFEELDASIAAFAAVWLAQIQTP